MKKKISILLAFMLVITTLMPANVMAAGNDSIYYSDENNKTFESNVIYDESDKNDMLSLEIRGKKMLVEFACSDKRVLEYRFALSKPFDSLFFAKPTNGVIKEAVDLSDIKNGRYYLMISRAMNEEQMDRWHYGDGSSYRVATINIKGGNITIDKYVNIIKNNEELRNKPSYKDEKCHLDKSLKDMDFVLTDYNKKVSALTPLEQQYIKNVSENITKGCTSDYEKARAIYHFVGENVYYDKLSNEKDHTRAYLHPYRNLKAIVDKVKLPNSTGDGKVATLCTGYSSMTIALLRAQGIPARMIYGYHLHTTENTWDQIKESEIKNRSSHYWTEAYIGGKWITCDSYLAGANKWERTSFDQSGKWVTRGFTNYRGFNPTEHQLAVSHYGQGVFTKSIITDKNEVDKFRNIFMAKDGKGRYNYKKLGMAPEDIDGQGNFIYLNNPLLTYTGRKNGQVEKIDWKGKNIAFDGNLKDLYNLKWLNIGKNPGVKNLNVSNNKELLSIYASSCNIKTFYGINCPKISKISTLGNPLTFAKYTFKGSNVATVKVRNGGTFTVLYKNGVHTLTAVPKRGYKFTGWYNNKGSRVTRNKVLTVRTSASFERRAGFVKAN